MKDAVERDERSRGWTGPVLLVALAVLALTVVYVLSVGPAEMLIANKKLVPPRGFVSECIVAFYAPLRFVSDHWKAFDTFMGWYNSFFVD